MNIHSVLLYFSKTLFSVTLLSFIFFSPAANAKEQISISWHMLYLCMRRQNILWFRQGMQKNHKMIQKFKSIIHDDDDLTIYSYTFFGFLLESSGRWIEKLLLLFHWYISVQWIRGKYLRARARMWEIFLPLSSQFDCIFWWLNKNFFLRSLRTRKPSL